MLYTNYKQIAEITFNSKDAENLSEFQTETLLFQKLNEKVLDADGDIVSNLVNNVLEQAIHAADNSETVDFISKYRFKVNLLNPMSKNIRVAVKSFVHHNTLISGSSKSSWDEIQKPIGNIYIDNLYDKNSYNTDSNIRNKLHLLSYPLCFEKVETYYNNDILNTSKSIQNTVFQNNYIDIVVDASIQDVNAKRIIGCPKTSSWSLTLVLYDVEMEENPKTFSDFKMPLLPAKY